MDAGVSAETGADGPAFDVARRFAQYLTGRMDSSAQAMRDGRYYAVQLHSCRVDAPAVGAYVLYVEQAMMTSLSQPYRQRFYAVESLAEPGRAVSRVFEPNAPARLVGLCNRDAGVFSARPSDMTEIPGCRVEVSWTGTAFEGGTVGQECANTLMGAAYATSRVTLTADTLESWDRGYDEGGTQVWGARAGPYVFQRRTPLPQF